MIKKIFLSALAAVALSANAQENNALTLYMEDFQAGMPYDMTYYDLDNPLTIYTVTGPGMPAEGEVTGLYDLEKLEVYDKYAAFLHGNNGLSRVEGDGEGSILVVKDSYANSLVPFLTANYAAVDVVDLRNYNYGLDALIEANGYDAILLLYSFDSFKADPYLYRAGIEG